MDKKCPNCGAEMQEEKFRLVCNYCDTVITLKNEENVSQEVETENEETLTPAQELFEIGSISHQKSLTVFKEMCAWINSRDTVETYLEFINGMARKNDDFSTITENIGILRTAESKVCQQFVNGEKSILYVNNGIFSKGKDGFLVSDKAIYMIKKKGGIRISYENFHSLLSENDIIGSTAWHINGDRSLRLYCAICTDVGFGVVLGMICTLARDSNPNGYKIAIRDIN